MDSENDSHKGEGVEWGSSRRFLDGCRIRGRPTRGTILTVRVKKSDAEAFAKSKLTLEEFRKKAKIAAYVGNADRGGGMGFGSGFGSSSGFSYDFAPFNQNR